MKTFFQMRASFLEALTQLKRLEGHETVTQAMRVVQERETGKLCYQAEEYFAQAELSLLKDLCSMRKSLWETCKQKCRENFPT